MAKGKKMCFDKVLPREIRRSQRVRMVGPRGRLEAVIVKGKNWINGSTIGIRFLNGTADQKNMVKNIAPEWTKHANLTFDFTDHPRAEIRVTFNENDGAWSYVGIDNLGTYQGNLTTLHLILNFNHFWVP